MRLRARSAKTENIKTLQEKGKEEKGREGARRTRGACGVLQSRRRGPSGRAHLPMHPFRSIFAKPMPTAARHRPLPLANGLVYVNPEMPGCAACGAARSFRYRDAKGRMAARRRRDLAHPATGHSARVHRRLDLPAAQRPPAGHRARRARAQAVPLPRRMARAEGRDQVRAARGLRPRAAAHPRARGARPADRRASGRRWRASRCWPRWCGCSTPPSCAWATRNTRSSNGSFGLTTLRNRHADVRGARSGCAFAARAAWCTRRGSTTRAWRGSCGAASSCRGRSCSSTWTRTARRAAIVSTDVNDYLREAAGDDFTAKDFRTWHGTVQALELTRLACRTRSGGRVTRHALQRQGDPGRGGQAARQHAGGLQEGLRAPGGAGARQPSWQPMWAP